MSSPTPTTFQKTLQAARAGDRQALEDLCEQFYPTVRSMVHRSLACDLRIKRPWISSLFSTGDVVHEVFQGVLRDLDKVEGQDEEAFAGFLARLVRNRLIDAIRFHEAARRDRRLAAVSLDKVDPASSTRGPSARVAMEEEFSIYLAALEEFSQRERLLLRERMEREESFVLLAELLAYPSPDAARKAFYTLQARLLMKLRKHGFGQEQERA